MLRFVPDHLKTKKMCKHAVKKLLFLIRCFADHYKMQEMCDKTILENGVMLKSALTPTKFTKCVIKLYNIHMH